jgi:hypothetical protein
MPRRARKRLHGVGTFRNPSPEPALASGGATGRWVPPVKRPRTLALRYGVAALAVGVALLVKVLLDPLTVQDTPFLLVFGAIMVSAWYGGLGTRPSGHRRKRPGNRLLLSLPKGLLHGVRPGVYRRCRVRARGDAGQRADLIAALGQGSGRGEGAGGSGAPAEPAPERGALPADGRGRQGLCDLYARPRRVRQ